jgi:anti-sigma regulatory factor (Ser/Thr protein kinase)
MRCALRGDSHAPAAARREVSEFLEGPDLPRHLVDGVVLVVSELVTNAIDAGATSIGLRIDIVGHQIRMSVEDDTGGWPTPATPGPTSTRGRGLTIVGKTANSWEVERTRSGKKVTAYFTTSNGPSRQSERERGP